MEIDPTHENAGSSEAGTTQLRRNLGRVLASGDARLVRLGAAETSISFRTLDAPDASVTILLDRDPPLLADVPAPLR